MSLKKVTVKEFDEQVIKLIGDEWMLISVGNKESFNSMTANWGGIGYLWDKPVVFVFVREERYTYEFMEKNATFTLCFFDKVFKPALALFGSKSGRDINKVAASGLTPMFTDTGNPAYREAKIIMECRKLYAEPLKAERFIDKALLEKFYTTKGGLHKMYVAEIDHLWL